MREQQDDSRLALVNSPPPLDGYDMVLRSSPDLEFGTAAAVARWNNQGKTVLCAMVANGEAGIDALDPDQCKVVREAEQIESAWIVESMSWNSSDCPTVTSSTGQRFTR